MENTGGIELYLKADSSDSIRTTLDMFRDFQPVEPQGFFSSLKGRRKDTYVLTGENYDSSELGDALGKHEHVFSDVFATG